VRFTAFVAAGNSYVWNFGDPTSASNTSALTNPIHEFTQPGTYTVTLTVTNVASGCVTIEKRTITVVFVGISSANKEVFNFYAAPNPYVGSTNLNFNLKQTSIVKIEMYDLLGRKVKNILELTEMSAGDHKVELMNSNIELPNGIYLIKLNVDGNESVIRVQDNSTN
jgi:PKD repeat protein